MVKKGKEEVVEEGEGEETPKVPKGEWKVSLAIVDEEKPPKKYLVKGEETLDLYAAIAKLLNGQEKIKEALLS